MRFALTAVMAGAAVGANGGCSWFNKVLWFSPHTHAIEGDGRISMAPSPMSVVCGRVQAFMLAFFASSVEAVRVHATRLLHVVVELDGGACMHASAGRRLRKGGEGPPRNCAPRFANATFCPTRYRQTRLEMPGHSSAIGRGGAASQMPCLRGDCLMIPLCIRSAAACMNRLDWRRNCD